MFTIQQLYDGQLVPLDMMYLDAYAGALTLANVTIQADADADTLTAPAPLTVTFDGQAFPLSGANYRAATTGALTLSVDPSALTAGIYTYPLLSTSGQWQGVGRFAWSFAGWGVAGRGSARVLPLVYVSVYAFAAATTPTLPATVPTSAWRT